MELVAAVPAALPAVHAGAAVSYPMNRRRDALVDRFLLALNTAQLRDVAGHVETGYLSIASEALREALPRPCPFANHERWHFLMYLVDVLSRRRTRAWRAAHPELCA